MDENKLAKMKEVGYKHMACCLTCKYSNINPGCIWGTCKLYTYKHKKHTGHEREMSVMVTGSCPAWDGDEEKRDALEGVYKNEV